MAKRKPPQDASATKKLQTTKVTLSLDSQPISLLWAHQLRRENKLLLDRIEALSAEVRDNAGQSSSTELAKAFADISKTSDHLARLQGEFVKINADIDALKNVQDAMNATLSNINEVMSDTDQFKEKVENIRHDWQDKIAGIEQRLRRFVDKDDLKLVTDQLSDLDKRLLDLLEQDNILVRDSMGGVGKLMEAPVAKSQALSLEASNRATERGGLGAGGLLNEEESEPEIDLDENVETISYAGHHIPPAELLHDSLVMIPVPQRSHTPVAITDLGQNTEPSIRQSLQELAGKYDKIVELFSKQEESSIVRDFVSNIESLGERQACQAWLDERHWIWVEVVSFIHQHRPTTTIKHTPQEQRQERAQSTATEQLLRDLREDLMLGGPAEKTAQTSNHPSPAAEVPVILRETTKTRGNKLDNLEPCHDKCFISPPNRIVPERDAGALQPELDDLDDRSGGRYRHPSNIIRYTMANRLGDYQSGRESLKRAVTPNAQEMPVEAETDPYTLPSPPSIPILITPGDIFPSAHRVGGNRETGKRRQLDYKGHPVSRREIETPVLSQVSRGATVRHQAGEEIGPKRHGKTSVTNHGRISPRRAMQRAHITQRRHGHAENPAYKYRASSEMTTDPAPVTGMAISFIASSPPFGLSYADMYEDIPDGALPGTDIGKNGDNDSSNSPTPVPESQARRGTVGVVQRVVMKSKHVKTKTKAAGQVWTPPPQIRGRKRKAG